MSAQSDFPPKLPDAFSGMPYADLYKQLRCTDQYYEIVHGIVFKKHKRNRPPIDDLSLEPALQASLVALGATQKNLTTLRRLYAHQKNMDSGPGPQALEADAVDSASETGENDFDDDNDSDENLAQEVVSRSSSSSLGEPLSASTSIDGTSGATLYATSSSSCSSSCSAAGCDTSMLHDFSSASSGTFSFSSSCSAAADCAASLLPGSSSASSGTFSSSSSCSAHTSTTAHSQAPANLFDTILSKANLESFNNSVLEHYLTSKEDSGQVYLSAATIKSQFSNLISLVRQIGGGPNLSLLSNDHGYLREPALRCIECLQDLAAYWTKRGVSDTAKENVRMRRLGEDLEDPLLTLGRVYFFLFVQSYSFFAEFYGVCQESKGGRPVKDHNKLLRQEQEMKSTVGGYIRLCALLGRPLLRANALDTLSLQDSTAANRVLDRIYVSTHKTVTSYGPILIRYPTWCKTLLNVYLRGGLQIRKASRPPRPFARNWLLEGVPRVATTLRLDKQEQADLLRDRKKAGLPKPRQSLNTSCSVIPHELLLLPNMARQMRCLISNKPTQALTVAVIRELVTSAADRIPLSGSVWTEHRNGIRESAAHCLREDSKTVENFYAPGLLDRRETSLQAWLEAEVVLPAMQWVVKTLCGERVQVQDELKASVAADTPNSLARPAAASASVASLVVGAAPAPAGSAVAAARAAAATPASATPRTSTPPRSPAPKRIKTGTAIAQPTGTAQPDVKDSEQAADPAGAMCKNCGKRVVYLLPSGKAASKCEQCSSAAKLSAKRSRERKKKAKEQDNTNTSS